VAKPEDPSDSARETSAVSPSKRIALRMKCIEQLEKWHSFLEKTVITQEQYAKLQQSILNVIKVILKQFTSIHTVSCIVGMQFI